MTPNTTSGQTRSSAGTVILVCPGGLENGGGIGRQMGYFLGAQASGPADLTYRVLDSRGPWFLGASPLHIGLSACYLAWGALRMIGARLSGAPCVVHINFAGRGSTVRKIFLAAVARGLALRYLLHVHAYDYAAEYRARSAPMRFLTRWMFHGAAQVLVLGADDRRALVAALQLPPERIAVLHNAVPDPWPAAVGARPDAPCHLVFLGYLSARKGVPDLLRALASPVLTSRPWRATLAGGGPVDEFRRLTEELGIAGRVAFPGWLDQAAVKALCADADVLVLPSHAEGLAMAVLEGLAHGLAVVATPVGAHAEVIEPGVSGLLLPPGDVTALAEALARVVDDRALRERLQVGARRRFLEKFEVRSYAERLGHLHASLLSDRPDFGAIGREWIS